MLVFVKNKSGKPLMPCSPSKARKLLKNGKAKCFSKMPFTIQLLHGSSGFKQEIVGGMDVGSKVIGTAAVGNGRVLYQAETLLRGEEIKRKMTQRRMFRQNRRYRLRFRKKRFLNRRSSLMLGRLPSSTKHKITAHLHEKNFIESILPIKKWRVETASFDISKINKIMDQKDSNSLNAKSEFYNTKQYILYRDKYTCQKCKNSKSDKLHVHHIIFKSLGGTNAFNNLITLCKSCHERLHNSADAVKESKKLQKYPQVLYKHMTETSIVSSQLHKKLGIYEETFGYLTKLAREGKNITKTHYNDAICIANFEVTDDLNKALYLRRFVAKGDYKQTFGANSKKIIPTKKLYGLRKFDLVKVDSITGFVKGKTSAGYFALSDVYGNTLSRTAKVKNHVQRIQSRRLVICSCKIL